MPGGDRTGPGGQDNFGGRGMGRGIRAGIGAQQGTPGAGPNGFCVCPACKEQSPHQRGVPCASVKCPKCGAAMVRQ